MASLHALLIGVPLYDDSGIKDLPFIENDLAELKYALNLKGYQCQVNRFDRTDRDSLDQAIERFLRFAERGSNILVFLSGHGVHYRGADYLVASTAMTHTSNFPSRCLKIDFNGYVEDSTAANVIIAIDACREGIDLRSKSGFNVDGWSTPKRLMVRSRQLAYVYACSAGERAHYTGRQGREFSAFTRAFSEVVGELSGEPYTVIELQSSIQEKLDQISGKHQLPKQSVRVVSEARVDPLNLIGTQRVVTRKHARWSQVLRVLVTSRLALAAVVLASLIGILPQLPNFGAANLDPSVSASAPAPTPPAPIGTASPAGPAGVVCTPNLGENVTLLSVRSTDGNEVIGGNLEITLQVNRPPPPGGSYWLMARLPVDPRPIEIARKILSQEANQTIRLSISSGVGSVRTFYVAESEQGANGWFEENRDHDGDSLWDNNRVARPVGARVASNSCEVERGR